MLVGNKDNDDDLSNIPHNKRNNDDDHNSNDIDDNSAIQVCFPWLDSMFIYYSPLTRETFLVILPPWCTRQDQNICSTNSAELLTISHRRFQIKFPFSFCLFLWKLWIPLDCVFIFTSRAGKLLLCPELQCAKTSFQMEFLEISNLLHFDVLVDKRIHILCS